MPRKQRFKPSRKPQPPSASPQVDDRQEIPPSEGMSQARDATAVDDNLDPERSR